MAGQPKQRALRVRLAEAARAAGAASAEAWFVGRIGDGDLFSAICAELGCTRFLLYVWINKNDARLEAFHRARAMAADSFADEAATIVDAADPDTIGVARARAEIRKWLAQSFNRDQYAANAPAPAPALSIGQVHLWAASKSTEELRRIVEAYDRSLPAAGGTGAKADGAPRGLLATPEASEPEASFEARPTPKV